MVPFNVTSLIYRIIHLCQRDFAKAKTFSFKCIHQTLLILQYKRQDKAGNSNSERIQSVVCEDTLRVNRIIVV